MRPGGKPGGGYAWYVSKVRRVLSRHEVPPFRGFPPRSLTQATILSRVASDGPGLRAPTDSPRLASWSSWQHRRRRRAMAEEKRKDWWRQPRWHLAYRWRGSERA